jgi:hypothetical protein
VPLLSIPLHMRPALWDSAVQMQLPPASICRGERAIRLTCQAWRAPLTSPVRCRPACPFEDQDEASLPAGTEAVRSMSSPPDGQTALASLTLPERASAQRQGYLIQPAPYRLPARIRPAHVAKPSLLLPEGTLLTTARAMAPSRQPPAACPPAGPAVWRCLSALDPTDRGQQMQADRLLVGSNALTDPSPCSRVHYTCRSQCQPSTCRSRRSGG